VPSTILKKDLSYHVLKKKIKCCTGCLVIPEKIQPLRFFIIILKWVMCELLSHNRQNSFLYFFKNNKKPRNGEHFQGSLASRCSICGKKLLVEYTFEMVFGLVGATAS
jgi:hypothetical protein